MAVSSPRAHSRFLPDDTSTRPATPDRDWFSWREKEGEETHEVSLSQRSRKKKKTLPIKVTALIPGLNLNHTACADFAG